MEINIKDMESLPEAAKAFIGAMGDYTVFAFRGEMGAGKTTFISELCRQLGIEDIATSPSFSIINEYRSSETAELVYHFDCYRLEKEEEAEDIGVEDYFYSGALCFVEWPERIESFLPLDTVEVEITVDPETGARKLTMDFPQ